MEIFLAEKKEVEKKFGYIRFQSNLALFRNEWFMLELDEMFHQNASRFGSFHLELYLQ